MASLLLSHHASAQAEVEAVPDVDGDFQVVETEPIESTEEIGSEEEPTPEEGENSPAEPSQRIDSSPPQPEELEAEGSDETEAITSMASDSGSRSGEMIGEGEGNEESERVERNVDLPELEEPEERTHTFGFGSYGRVGVGTNFQGATPRPLSVVSHGPRLVETPYLEMDFYYTIDPAGPYVVRTVTTLGFTEDLFHYTGDWSSMLALRNLYAEFVYNGEVSVWAGSRSYRGDDIFLLDFWPLDNLNTVGGGLGFQRDRIDLRWHMGVNRLLDDFTYQEIDVPARLFGAERIVLMDRQRLLTSLSGSYRVLGSGAGPSLKIKAYFEFHYLSDGTFHREDQTEEDLPSDFGWTGGLQLGTWGWGERASHANLFLRFSQGLAAYGEMGIPFGVNDEKRTFPTASELMVGLATNWERGRFGFLGASYLRRFVDADVNVYDEDDGWEFVLDVRPWFQIIGPLQIALDLSWQQRFPTGYSPTALEVLQPAIFQMAPMIIFAPLGPGSYERPHIRLVYRFAYLNDGALDTYSLKDPRHNEPFVHYLGVQVEWWYNSSYR